jgi:hypothetical protein
MFGFEGGGIWFGRDLFREFAGDFGFETVLVSLWDVVKHFSMIKPSKPVTLIQGRRNNKVAVRKRRLCRCRFTDDRNTSSDDGLLSRADKEIPSRACLRLSKADNF